MSEPKKRGKKKGAPKSGGRVAGTPNKVTSALKDMILHALDGVGGVEYLMAQAIENPTAFMTLVGKVLPLQVSGDPSNPIGFRIETVIVDPADPAE